MQRSAHAAVARLVNFRYSEYSEMLGTLPLDLLRDLLPLPPFLLLSLLALSSRVQTVEVTHCRWPSAIAATKPAYSEPATGRAQTILTP